MAADPDHKSVSNETVARIVAEVVGSMRGDVSSADFAMYQELLALAEYIRGAKQEIAALKRDDLQNQHFRTAADELDAIVAATEDATNNIMEAAELVETTAETLEGDSADQLGEAVTKIYEACSFQDITGQRIGKVVNALKHIETKIADLITAFGEEGAHADGAQAAPAAPARSDDARPDAHLLNGPQLTHTAKSQDEIDALFDSLG